MSGSFFLGGIQCSRFSDAIINTYVPVCGLARTLADSRFHVLIFFGGGTSFSSAMIYACKGSLSFQYSSLTQQVLHLRSRTVFVQYTAAS